MRLFTVALTAAAALAAALTFTATDHPQARGAIPSRTHPTPLTSRRTPEANVLRQAARTRQDQAAFLKALTPPPSPAAASPRSTPTSSSPTPTAQDATAASPQAAPAAASAPTDTSTPAASGDYDHRWDRVAMCEEGGWGPGDLQHPGYQHGPTYFGNLGISAPAWDEYGGGIDRNNATPAEQVMVAERIQSNPPDQNGCAGW